MAIKTQVSLTMYSFIKTKFLMDNQIKLNNSLKSIPIPKILLYFKCVSRTIMRCYKMYLFDTFISVGYLTQIKYRCLCLFYLFIDTLLIPFFVFLGYFTSNQHHYMTISIFIFSLQKSLPYQTLDLVVCDN